MSTKLSEKISELIESNAETMVEKFARYISDQYEDMDADDLIKGFKKFSNKDISSKKKSSPISTKKEKKSSPLSKKGDSNKSKSSSSKGKTLKQKIAEAKDEDKFYNVKSGRKTKHTKQQENRGLTFYPKYNICGEKGSKKLKDVIEELDNAKNKSDDDNDSEEEEASSTKDSVKEIKKDESAKKEKPKFAQNDHGNYEHKETGLVINPKTKQIFGKQDDEGDVLALTDKDVEVCKKYNFKFVQLEQDKIDENIMELSGFHQKSKEEEEAELNLD